MSNIQRYQFIDDDDDMMDFRNDGRDIYDLHFIALLQLLGLDFYISGSTVMHNPNFLVFIFNNQRYSVPDSEINRWKMVINNGPMIKNSTRMLMIKAYAEKFKAYIKEHYPELFDHIDINQENTEEIDQPKQLPYSG